MGYEVLGEANSSRSSSVTVVTPSNWPTACATTVSSRLRFDRQRAEGTSRIRVAPMATTPPTTSRRLDASELPARGGRAASETSNDSRPGRGTGRIAEDGVFVVGTDTGVGKTVVTAGLTGWLRETGTEAVAVKPCQTGYPPDDDAAFVESVCGTADAAVCLQRLSPPLAPEVAAREADDDVTLSYESTATGSPMSWREADR